MSTPRTASSAKNSKKRSRWFTKRALIAHLAIAIWLPGCAVAAWWQVTVALAGNDLAYLYSVEWPCFAVFGVVAWWNLVHDDPDSVGARALRKQSAPKPAQRASPVELPRNEPDDEELVAYNAYLAALSERGAPKTWKRG
ncbi:MAG: hypothetical protein WCF24_08940 [Acidimicrobiales bacterium]